MGQPCNGSVDSENAQIVKGYSRWFLQVGIIEWIYGTGENREH